MLEKVGQKWPRGWGAAFWEEKKETNFFAEVPAGGVGGVTTKNQQLVI